MNGISLRAFIDDILLLVRNNNISESEDLSREQIAGWIKAYKAAVLKEQQDKDEKEDNDGIDDSLTSTIVLDLEDFESPSGEETFTKVTTEELPGILNNSENNIISVFDEEGCPIQSMNEFRRHFHYFRKYTYGEMTYFYDEGKIYVQGLVDKGQLSHIYVTGIFEDGDDVEEDKIMIPAWMVPTIKNNILKNELAFMLQRPSDDSNNATLASVKPHGPQDAEE